MDILLVSATEAELDLYYKTVSENDSIFSKHRIQTLVTGIGPASAAYCCGRALARNDFGLVINLGIAGSLLPDIKPGEAVVVSKDRFFMLGSEDHEQFLSVFDLGLADPDAAPYQGGFIRADSQLFNLVPKHIKIVEGITVQCAHGRMESIDRLKKFYPEAAIESQEGAAVMMAAVMSGTPGIQLRGISNLVEPRNRSSWQIQPALQAVTDLLVGFLGQLPESPHGLIPGKMGDYN